MSRTIELTQNSYDNDNQFDSHESDSDGRYTVMGDWTETSLQQRA